jgi:hypothetical protein
VLLYLLGTEALHDDIVCFQTIETPFGPQEEHSIYNLSPVLLGFSITKEEGQ